MLGQIASHQSPAHLQVNRNKRSTLDVRTDAGRSDWKLFETADVFVDGLLSGRAIGWASGMEQRRRKPSIVIATARSGDAGEYRAIPTTGR
jgi:crotonobetainyl-CoA:carnitine CoA-transferase CaiB-like acyl-CoA transferase